MTAVILAGGDIEVTSQLRKLVEAADLVIAADSGLRHAKPLGLTPNLIVGDFDSVSDEDLKTYSHIPKERHPVQKNNLDLELALERTTARSPKRILLVGTLGGRFDQSLAAVFIAAKHANNAQVSLHSGFEDLYILQSKTTKRLETIPKQRFSLLSLCQAAMVSISGAQYTLEKKLLDFGVGLGVSNETLEPELVVTVHDGLVALILEHGESAA